MCGDDKWPPPTKGWHFGRSSQTLRISIANGNGYGNVVPKTVWHSC